MKKTIKVSLGSLAYNIDEDAYSILETYISTLKTRLINDKEGNEIIQDIEERISELFSEKKGISESISIDLVKEVLEILGDPDEIASGSENNSRANITYRSNKRLYRDSEHSYIAGVCSGVGEYFGTDPVVIRLIFLLLCYFSGFGALLYLVLWIAVPKAITPKQKLEMKGEPINITNIEKTIREESAHIDRSIKKGGIRGFIENIVYLIGRIVYWFIQFLLILIKAIAIIVAVLLIVTMLIALFALVNVIFFGNLLLHGAFPSIQGIPLGDVITSMFEFSSSIWLTIPIFVIIAIPLLVLLYLGIRILFRFKARDGLIGLMAAVVWIFAIVVLSFAIYYQAKGFTVRKHITETVTITPKLKKGGILHIQAIDKSDSLFSTSSNVIEIDEYSIAKINGKNFITGKPSITIEKSDKEFPVIEFTRSARGANKIAAEINAKSIKYRYSVKDTLLTFDSYFILPLGEKWKLQDLSIVLQIPENFKIYIDGSMENLMNPHQPKSDYWPNEMIERKWVMKEKTLKELENK
jgi:phage shock protein PspC (stress-responsive transcriptional regulator)